MSRYAITWDEIVTYTVEVEADNVDDAWDAFCDEARRLTEPEVVCSDYADNWEIEEV